MRKAVIVGLGLFGLGVASTLAREGFDILGMDIQPDLINRLAADKILAYVAIGDGAHRPTLEALAIDGSFEAGVVAMSGQLSGSILAVMNLKELGVKKVLAKARSEQEKRALLKVGADDVVLPESAMGEIIGRKIAHPTLKLFSLNADYTLLTFLAGNNYAGKTILEMDLRRRFRANILTVESGGKLVHDFAPDQPLKSSDKLTVLVPVGFVSNILESIGEVQS